MQGLTIAMDWPMGPRAVDPNGIPYNLTSPNLGLCQGARPGGWGGGGLPESRLACRAWRLPPWDGVRYPPRQTLSPRLARRMASTMWGRSTGNAGPRGRWQGAGAARGRRGGGAGAAQGRPAIGNKERWPRVARFSCGYGCRVL